MLSFLTHPFLEYSQRQGAQYLPRLPVSVKKGSNPVLPIHPERNKMWMGFGRVQGGLLGVGMGGVIRGGQCLNIDLGFTYKSTLSSLCGLRVAREWGPGTVGGSLSPC